MGFEKVYNLYVFEPILVHGTMLLKASLHGAKKKRGGWVGRSPPPICKHKVFITGSEPVHMGSVLAGRMMLEVVLHSLKKRGGWGRRSPPFANRLPACGVEKVRMASVFASPGVGGKQPPRLQIDCLHGGI